MSHRERIESIVREARRLFAKGTVGGQQITLPLEELLATFEEQSHPTSCGCEDCVYTAKLFNLAERASDVSVALRALAGRP